MKKLIRDKIPEVMESAGLTCKYYVADEKEFRERLIEKLGEECAELQEALRNGTQSDIIEECVDVDDVMGAIKCTFITDSKKYAYVDLAKGAQKGIFEKHLVGEFPDKK